MSNVIVIGNGLAGLSASLEAAKGEAHVILVSPQDSERSQSVLAAGGTNAALDNKGQNDSIHEHFRDTMKAGCDLADPKAVERLTSMAPEIIGWLADIGVAFDRTTDGAIDQRYFGGQKKMRTTFSKSGIGKQIVAALSLEKEKYIYDGSITEMTGYEFDSLVMGEDTSALGCRIRDVNSGELKELRSDCVIVATGGLNGLFARTTGSVTNTGMASARLFKQGALFGNLEMIQFHPTTTETADKSMLISEAGRGEGGRLFVYRDNQKWYFMEERYPEVGNLAPRDVVSFEEYRVSTMENYGRVYLDMTHLSRETIDEKLKEIKDLCKTYLGIDISKEPVPVKPGIHYFMGGIMTDREHRTSIPRVFAAGECACIYHGANRLGGNSTLGAIAGGLIAGRNACRLGPAEGMAIEASADEKEICESEKTKIRDILGVAMPVLRHEDKMNEGLEELVKLENTIASNNEDDCTLKLAEAVVRSGINRKESRGAHRRADYPERNYDFADTTVTFVENGEVKVVRMAADTVFDWGFDNEHQA